MSAIHAPHHHNHPHPRPHRTLAHRIATAVKLRVNTEGGRAGLSPITITPVAGRREGWAKSVVDAIKELPRCRGGRRLSVIGEEEDEKGGNLTPIDAEDVENFDPTPLRSVKPVSKSKLSKEVLKPSGTTLSSLPSELLISIAARSGFWASLNLSYTSRRFRSLLSDRAAWREHLATDGADELIVNEVTITTRVGVYDHLLFGVWQGEDGEKDGDSLFFIHKTFNDDYDFLGGVSFKLLKGGLVEPSFFEHRELLPCYLLDLQTHIQTGSHPPTIHLGTTPPSNPVLPDPIGTRIPHSCSSCSHYDTQTVQKSVFVMNDQPLDSQMRQGVEWCFEHPDGRRVVRVRVRPYRGMLGYGCDGDLPMVTVNEVSVAERRLRGGALDVFARLVNGREC
ncbi:hypothetical protein HK097_008422 [Rhizophlyctis rosea]|uniref:F-box domain-containing protein n=1 Tax=Rhizophlyctis rosea TaxID=64517 RepID=A0AAD5SBV2_9FUNG|nr:hypothetical protein HK097_008422 [Rhizophlyctis rosea]